jgi:hypothetical protein
LALVLIWKSISSSLDSLPSIRRILGWHNQKYSQHSMRGLDSSRKLDDAAFLERVCPYVVSHAQFCAVIIVFVDHVIGCAGVCGYGTRRRIRVARQGCLGVSVTPLRTGIFALARTKPSLSANPRHVAVLLISDVDRFHRQRNMIGHGALEMGN